MPIPGYHKGVEELAHKYGAMYIADEVQTGLMRSGEMWCCCKFGATPDIIVTAKGLSGGYYPNVGCYYVRRGWCMVKRRWFCSCFFSLMPQNWAAS